MSFFRHQHSWNDLEKERPIFTASLLTIPVGQDIPGKLLSSRACFRLPVWTKLILDLGTKKFLTFTQQNNCPANLDHLILPPFGNFSIPSAEKLPIKLLLPFEIAPMV